MFIFFFCFVLEQNIDQLEILPHLSEVDLDSITNSLIGDKIKLKKAIRNIALSEEASIEVRV